MKMYLISDNTDTLTGMRLAGVEGILVRSRDQVKKALEDAVSDKDNGILLLTESLGKQYPDLVRITRTGHKMPLLIEIPDRHGTGPETGFHHRIRQRGHRAETLENRGDCCDH